MSAETQQVTEYFGEGYDPTDPSKVLRVIRDFMLLFDKAMLEIKVRGPQQSCQHPMADPHLHPGCDGSNLLRICWLVK